MPPASGTAGSAPPKAGPIMSPSGRALRITLLKITRRTRRQTRIRDNLRVGHPTVARDQRVVLDRLPHPIEFHAFILLLAADAKPGDDLAGAISRIGIGPDPIRRTLVLVIEGVIRKR